MQLVAALLVLLLLTTSVWALPVALTDGTAATLSGTPTVSSCGTSPSVSGDNGSGIITVGSGVSVLSCTLSFSATLSAAPVCIAVPNSAISLGVSTSTTALTITMALTLGDGKIFYVCRGT
jgi:hypothetical protein